MESSKSNTLRYRIFRPKELSILRILTTISLLENPESLSNSVGPYLRITLQQKRADRFKLKRCIIDACFNNQKSCKQCDVIFLVIMEYAKKAKN